MADLKLKWKPVTQANWQQLENLFGERGACGGCWCMFWRIRRKLFNEQKGDGNKQALRAIVDSGEIPGIISFLNEQPIGWCSIGPRDQFPVLNNSKILRKVDAQPVWSLVCLFIDKKYRKQGLSAQIISAAVEFAGQQGAKVVEAYPVDPIKGKMPDLFAWTGFAPAFKQAGFEEVIRRSETRPIMRYYLND